MASGSKGENRGGASPLNAAATAMIRGRRALPVRRQPCGARRLGKQGSADSPGPPVNGSGEKTKKNVFSLPL